MAAIWLVPVLLVIPFLLPIMIFLGGHFSWTVAARFAAGWAGLGAYTKRMPFMNGFWNAFGLVLVFYLLWAVVSWAVLFGLAEWQAADQTGAANQVNALLSRYGVRIGWWLYLLVMAMILVPRVIDLSVHHSGAYGTFALLGRLLVVLPIAGGITSLLQPPLVELLVHVWKLGTERLADNEQRPAVLLLLSVPVFSLGVSIWLSSTILLSFEAHFLARLEGQHLADRFGPEDGATETDYRDLRKRWSNTRGG